MSRDFVIEQHKEWLGYLQSDSSGLVVAPAALKAAQIQVDKNIFDLNTKLRSILSTDGSLPVERFKSLLTDFFDWSDENISPAIESDFLVLTEYNETVRASLKLGKDEKTTAYVFFISDGKHFDDSFQHEESKWDASYQQKFERLLRDKDVPIGIMVGCGGIRLTYAPKQETSGYLTFPFSIMTTVEGRSTLSACHKLLSAWTIFYAPEASRLAKVLEESRKYQNTVSIALSGQVLSALYELVRGFDEAHRITNKRLLTEVLSNDPNLIYKGLLTVLLRSVFLLYAEDRDVLFNSKGEKRKTGADVFKNNYSINALYEQLRSDAAIHLDTMGQRFGAWGRMLSLFRAVYEGVEFEDFKLLGRKGHLFDPQRFQFLEGRDRQQEQFMPPPISDGTIFKVLNFLMTLDGERISYRTLDVEQIGSVYETVMGFRLEVATGPSIGIRPKKTHGAPVVINLAELLKVAAKDRPKWLKETSDQDEKSELLLKASSIDELVAALDRKVARQATPDVAPEGSLILQPSPERRKTGSHYTPRSLTEPIVRKALEPIIQRIGERPTPQQILALKVCDPAMGSGAFLVETCRQLAGALVKAWATHGVKPPIPPDETELLFAQRIVAKKCLYGVDKNPMAVDLAKLSLWLETFASDHEFTFLDHNLKCGDSLVGLDFSQILGATWKLEDVRPLVMASVSDRLKRVTEIRCMIQNSDDAVSLDQLNQMKLEEDKLLNDLRGIGDAVLYSYFSKDKDRARSVELSRIHLLLEAWFASRLPLSNYSGLEKELTDIRRITNPFHWQIEFPEVFLDSGSANSESTAFDVFIGNPPFLGGKRISTAFGDSYRDWLSHVNSSNKNADLVAHFFRRAFSMLSLNGCLGFIATNTISQGDTREAGLSWIVQHGGSIFHAIKRTRWPGQAAVIISVIHVSKSIQPKAVLDGKAVDKITAFLLSSGGSESPISLSQNKGLSYVGFYVLGMGFTFDDETNAEAANSISEMNDLLARVPASQQAIRPYLGGEELNDNPRSQTHRFVIDFNDLDVATVAARWPDLFAIVEAKVKPERVKVKRESLAEKWWQYADRKPALRKALSDKANTIACAQTSKYLSFCIVQADQVFSHKVIVFPVPEDQIFRYFCILQSRVHQEWADFIGSSMKDDPVYTPSDCFDTFPFPLAESSPALIEAGQQYNNFRSRLMIENNIGLTSLYNRFHAPEEMSQEILKLREQHATMDRIVLDSYGWSDIRVSHDFFVEYEEDEVDAESTGGRKKPWRYRWPEAIRDEVLARLLELNARSGSKQRGGT